MKFPAQPLTPRARRWLQVALGAWVIFAAALCVKVLIEGNGHSVYGAFVSGTRNWWAGQPMYLDRGYYYSPTFSVLFTPFALWPDRVGQLLWGLSSVTVFVWSLRVFYRDVLPQHWPREAEAAFLLLSLIGSLRGMWSLQSNAVLMACILGATAAIVRYRWWKAAWLLAAPVYIKVWPIVIGGLLAVHWPKKLLGRLTLACAALAMVPFATKAPAFVADIYKDWIECLAARQGTAMRFTGYRDAWTIWEQIHSPVSHHGYFWLQATAGLAVLGFSVWVRRRNPRELITCTLAAWSAWQLLFGPGSERLTFLIIAPFAAWSLMTTYFERRNFRLALVAFVTMFIFGSGGMERILVRVLPAAVAIQPIGVILFCIWLVRHAWQANGRQSSSAGSTFVAEGPPCGIGINHNLAA